MQPFPGDVATVERADLDRHFSGWMAEAEGKIRKMPVAERKNMRDELYGYAIHIAKGLGDARGAQLLQMLPQTKLYATALEDDRLTRGRDAVDLLRGAVDRLKTDIINKAISFGLSGDRMAERLETGAANAWKNAIGCAVICWSCLGGGMPIIGIRIRVGRSSMILNVSMKRRPN